MLYVFVSIYNERKTRDVVDDLSFIDILSNVTSNLSVYIRHQANVSCN